MNWLQKIFKYTSRNYAFFLIGRNLVFFSELHGLYLQKRFGVTELEGEALRFLFPRGRIIFTDSGTLIEASSELESYRYQIAKGLGLEPRDRSKWDFNSLHYQVSIEEIQTELEQMRLGMTISEGAMRILSEYAPELLQDIVA